MITDQHFCLYGKARSHLAALDTRDAPAGYGWVLLALDDLHADADLAPAVSVPGLSREELVVGAVEALSAIGRIDGVDALVVELLIADVEDSWAEEAGQP